MGDYHKLESMLEDELDKITSRGELTTSSLDVGDKVAQFLKSIKTIEAMDESYEGNSYNMGNSLTGYPYPMPNNAYDGNSYARGRGRNAKRDSMGRYSSANRGYSRNSKEDMMQELDSLRERMMEMGE